MNADGVARFRTSPERAGIILTDHEEGFFKVVGNAHVVTLRELDQTQALMGQVQFFDTNLSAFGVEIRRLEFDWHCFLQLPTDH